MEKEYCYDCKYHRSDCSDYFEDGRHVPNGCVRIIHVCCRLPFWYKDVTKIYPCPGKEPKFNKTN